MSSYTQAELSGKKVADLKSILTGFKLSTAGVKADLVNRILEHQNSGGDDGQAASAATAGTTADDTSSSKPTDAPAPTDSEEEPSSTSQAAAGAAEENVANGNAAATTDAGDATSASTDNKAAAAAAADAVDEAGKTDKSSEAEKRKARLMRFGNNEEVAKLERAEKFGTASADSISDKSVSKLDSELSNKRMRLNGDGDSKKTAAGKPKSQGGKPQSTNNGGSKPVSKGKPAPKSAGKAAPAVDPAEEERRRKRAERFAGGQ